MTAINHGLYTDTSWAVSLIFKNDDGAAANLSGFQYVMDVLLGNTVVFRFKSNTPGATEGTIGLASAASGQLDFTATPTAHVLVAAGIYRVHLKRDLSDDIWYATGKMKVGKPGERTTYLTIDRTSASGTSPLSVALAIPFSLLSGAPGDNAALASALALKLGVNSTPTERGFWTDVGAGANIWRVRDRFFVGDAADIYGGNWPDPGGTRTWVGESASQNMTYFEARSQFAVFNSHGSIAAAFASRTSDTSLADGSAAMGVGSFVDNNKNDLADKRSAWAFYGHAVNRYPNKFTTTLELDICNVAPAVDINPYNMAPGGGTVAAWLAAGGETAFGLVEDGQGATLTRVSAAIGIVNNGNGAAGNRFAQGIVFHSLSLFGTDGTGTGTAEALSMARGHQIVGRYGSGATDYMFKIRGDVSNSGLQSRIVFTDTGMEVRNVQADLTTENASIFTVLSTNATAVNGVRIFPGSTGGASILLAQGEANAAIDLRSKGSGTAALASGDGAHKVAVNVTGIGFYAATPVAKQTITGSRSGNAALADLLTKIALTGFLNDGTSA